MANPTRPSKDEPPSSPTTAAPITPLLPTMTRRDDIVQYRPAPGVHLAKAGRVALSNWVGRIGNRSVRVYRGAPADKIPAEVREAMAASGIGIGVLTLEELGLRSRTNTSAALMSTIVDRS